MGVLGVDTAEEHALTVDVDDVVLQCDVAESVFRLEGHFLIALGILLAEDEGIEDGIFCAPELKSGKGGGGILRGLHGFALLEGEVARPCAHLLAFGVEECDVDAL